MCALRFMCWRLCAVRSSSIITNPPRLEKRDHAGAAEGEKPFYSPFSNSPAGHETLWLLPTFVALSISRGCAQALGSMERDDPFVFDENIRTCRSATGLTE